MNNPNIWFKPKPYIHFSTKIIKSDLSWLSSFLKNDKVISNHAFLPLIHKVIYKRRFRRNQNRDLKTRIKLDPKPRHIYYSTHIDSHIYAYYASKLNELYDRELKKNDALDASVIAYRRIPKGFSNGNKSNIEFANEVFSFIKNQKKNCVALTFDIKNFFDDLDHKKLKMAWCKLLNGTTLPKDHLNIFKSLTNFSYVDEQDLFKSYGIKHRNDLKELKSKSITSNVDFRAKIIKGGLIKKNSKTNESGNIIGIPQGTPLSAFLSNLYLLEFDKEILDFLSLSKFSLYRRYSDDIVIVCDHSEKEKVEKFIYERIHEQYSLTIQPNKTECVCFTLNGGLLKSDKNMNYLGFAFDGSSILIKSSSLAGYYRTLKTYIKRASKRASKRKPGKNKNIFRRKIYKLGHLYRRNYYSYAMRASKVIDDGREQIKGQVKNHWKIIHKELKKRS